MPSDDGIIVLGIDLDGVCTSFSERMREIARESFEVEVCSAAGIAHMPTAKTTPWIWRLPQLPREQTVTVGAPSKVEL